MTMNFDSCFKINDLGGMDATNKTMCLLEGRYGCICFMIDDCKAGVKEKQNEEGPARQRGPRPEAAVVRT